MMAQEYGKYKTITCLFGELSFVRVSHLLVTIMDYVCHVVETVQSLVIPVKGGATRKRGLGRRYLCTIPSIQTRLRSGMGNCLIDVGPYKTISRSPPLLPALES